MKALYDLEKGEIFEKALPRAKEDERTFLSADLKEHGCMNPIVTYHGTIVDGHTRYDICHQKCEMVLPLEAELRKEGKRRQGCINYCEPG